MRILKSLLDKCILKMPSLMDSNGTEEASGIAAQRQTLR